MLIFPNLVIEKEFIYNAEKYYNVFLDWEPIDNYKIEYKKQWYLKYLNLDKLDSVILKQLLEEANWLEFLYPKEFENIYKKFSKFMIPIRYYNECIYLKSKAIEEYNRPKAFDTIVRETLSEVCDKYISLFFYMIFDGLHIYNLGFKSEEDPYCIFNAWLFRFWKSFTGGGLVIDKSFDFIKNQEYIDNIRPILNNNMKFNIFNIPNDLNEFEFIKKIIHQKKRDNKIKEILDEQKRC